MEIIELGRGDMSVHVCESVWKPEVRGQRSPLPASFLLSPLYFLNWGLTLSLGLMLPLPYILDRSSHWAWGLSVWLEWLADELQGSNCAGITDERCPDQLSCGWWEYRFSSAGSCGRLTQTFFAVPEWTTLPDPQCIELRYGLKMIV